MARLPRLTVPGYLHHAILRGNNRQPIFTDAQDRESLLALLSGNAAQLNVAVHAYVLMDNHFHLLATPADTHGLPRLMQAVGGRYAHRFNVRRQRSGTLWEGRYRATVIESERHLLACMAYIDLNPVRAGLTAQARDFPWSSHRHYIGERPEKWLTPHPLFWALGNTPFAREAAYAELVRAGIDPDQQQALTAAVLGGWALGTPEFMAELQKHTPRRVHKTAPGRPPRGHGLKAPAAPAAVPESFAEGEKCTK